MLCTTSRLSAKRQLLSCRRLLSSSADKSIKSTKPPLPPSPAAAKQEYLKSSSEDPLQKMARLQKELDIVRERAAERMEAKLNKSTWRRLTDPLRRHSHSWINVGAVLLAYILAHNLYMTGKEKRAVQQELEEATIKRDLYQQALRELLQETTLMEISNHCSKGLSSSDESSSSSSSWWNTSKTARLGVSEQQIIMQVLQKEIQARIGDHILTDEERRIKDMQTAWQESQQQIVVISPEQKLVQAVLSNDDTKELLDAAPKKQQRRVISM